MKHRLSLASLALVCTLSSAAVLAEEAPAPAPSATPAATPPAAPSATSYGCPMHPDVVADQPGRCPKCGMQLREKKSGATATAPANAPATAPATAPAAASAKEYVCPMHPDVVAAAPGKCPKCKMNLVEKGAAKVGARKHEHSPAHGGQLGMVGENHVEIVIPKAGAYEVWLSDAYRKPLPLAKATGTLTVTDPSGKKASGQLKLSPSGQSLVATTDPLTGTLGVEVSIAGVDAKSIDTEFQFEVK